MEVVRADNRQRVSESTVQAWTARHPGWTVSGGRLAKEFRFENFVDAFGFMARCACVFEVYDHHPLWSNVYSRVKVKLWTQLVSGVTHRDFQLAEELERLFATVAPAKEAA